MSIGVKNDRKSQKHSKFYVTGTIRKAGEIKVLDASAIPTFNKSGTISSEILLVAMVEIDDRIEPNKKGPGNIPNPFPSNENKKTNSN